MHSQAARSSLIFNLIAAFYCERGTLGSREAVIMFQRKAINFCDLQKIHLSSLLFLSSKKNLIHMKYINERAHSRATQRARPSVVLRAKLRKHARVSVRSLTEDSLEFFFAFATD